MSALLLFGLLFVAPVLAEQKGDKCMPDHEVMEQLLKGYDRRVEPKGVVAVESMMWLTDVEKVCSETGTAVIHIFLNDLWTDPRLDFKKYNPCHDSIMMEVFHLWTPKMNIIDSRSFEIHSSPLKNIFTLVYSNGTVWNDLRVKMAIPCMRSKDCESMTCAFSQESYEYSSEKVTLAWAKDPFMVFGSGSMAGWKLGQHSVSASAPKYPAGIWNNIKVELEFEKVKHCDA